MRARLAADFSKRGSRLPLEIPMPQSSAGCAKRSTCRRSAYPGVKTPATPTQDRIARRHLVRSFSHAAQRGGEGSRAPPVGRLSGPAGGARRSGQRRAREASRPARSGRNALRPAASAAICQPASSWRAVDTKSLSARLKNGKGACFREVCSFDTYTQRRRGASIESHLPKSFPLAACAHGGPLNGR